MDNTKVSFWSCFRLVFVILFLYLLQDVFFRYDGVRYYATLPDFLPSIALISVLWCVVSALAALLIWGFLQIFKLFAGKDKTENILLFISIALTTAVMIWVGKRLIADFRLGYLQKLIILSITVVGSAGLTWILRGKLWSIQERITPLVWLFGIIVLLSVPVVIYKIGSNHAGKLISHEGRQTSTADKGKPNIILITFDAMSARDMSLYGYHRPTTPFIDRWSQNANLFTMAQADGNYTFPTTLSLMTGQRAWTHKQYNPHGHKFSHTPENLARILKENNYYNIAFVQNNLASVKKLGIAEYFDIVPNAGRCNRPVSISGYISKLIYSYIGDSFIISDWIVQSNFLLGMIIQNISPDVYITEFPPNRVFNEVLQVVNGNATEPFFIWVHLNTPHDPYLPEEYTGLFDPSAMLKTKNEQYKFTRPAEDEIMKVEQAKIDVLRARYNEFIRYCDSRFEDFIAQFEKGKRSKNTVIILSSDHGESFEHDYLTHGGDKLYEAVTHIPLIIKEPDQTEGKVIHDTVAQIDIAPTILDYAGIPVPSWMEGLSLTPYLEGQDMPERPVFSMSLYRNPAKRNKITCGNYAVRVGDYKLIHLLEHNKSFLFNLKDDPGELNNLIDAEPEKGRYLLDLIKYHIETANQRMAMAD